MQIRPALSQIGTTGPSPARMYDARPGGKDSHTAGRRTAERGCWQLLNRTRPDRSTR
jgi:hypothetical protein